MRTRITDMLGIPYPIIAAPMFLVSNPELVAAVSNAGGLGTMPALNFRTVEEFDAGLQRIRELTDKPYGINIITNRSNIYQEAQLELCVHHKVPVVITSLGTPAEVIRKMHAVGGRVFCDVTNLDYGKKVQGLGADAVVAVAYGAGGHAGPIVASVLVPWLLDELDIPVIAAGGIADGRSLLSALALGADAGYMGTRFIASEEVTVNPAYKEEIVERDPEGIIYTPRVTGTPANFIRSDYLDSLGTELGIMERVFKKFSFTRKWWKMIKGYRAMKGMKKSADSEQKAWKDVWSAGQTVGLIHDVLPAREIVERVVREYDEAKNRLP